MPVTTASSTVLAVGIGISGSTGVSIGVGVGTGVSVGTGVGSSVAVGMGVSVCVGSSALAVVNVDAKKNPALIKTVVPKANAVDFFMLHRLAQRLLIMSNYGRNHTSWGHWFSVYWYCYRCFCLETQTR